MALTLCTGYLLVALVTAIVVFAAGQRWGDQRRSAMRRGALSLVAGIGWPVMLLGVIQLFSIAAYTKVSKRKAGNVKSGPVVVLV